ncbi:MAG: DNA polymerase III subunit gamma/tau [Pseudomonadota bacterium]
MSYQALARKWRPKFFSDLVGQEHVVTALTNALTTQRLHHAYLFTGTRGVGKTTLARILAKSLNCEAGITPTPCGTCGACVSIDSGNFVDLLEVDAATNTRVEEMRELLDNTQYLPTSGRFKVYIIDEVHMLSRSAFNSMLKTLEEPPEHVKFILATTDPQKVPVTVLSRCLQFNLKQMPRESIAGHLARVLTAENVSFEVLALDAVARAAQGSMRDSLSLLDQAIAYGAGTVNVATVSAMLGAIDQTYLFNLLEHIAARDGKLLIEEAERMAERSLSFDAALQELASVLHRIALLQTVPEAVEKEAVERARLEKLAQDFSPQDVQLFYQIAIMGRRDLPLAPDEFAGFTMAIMRMLAFVIDTSSGDQQRIRPEPTKAISAPSAQKLPEKHTEQAPVRSERPAEISIDKKEVSAGVNPAIRTTESVATPRTTAAVETEPAKESPPALKVDPTVLNTFDGNWLQLATNLKLAGMAGMLAMHCEIKSFAGNRMDLCVPPEYKHLAEKVFIEKLRTALSNHFGAEISLQITIGQSSGNTLAEVAERGRQAKQAEAVAAIGQDTFVRELVENMDARLIESSIKPI